MLLESLQSTVEEVNIFSTSDLFLRQRLELVESLWESVLKAECGLELVDLLKKLRKISSPEGQVTDQPKTSINELIEELELNEAIRATRAFALYFQLINIVEQHYEQRDQQLNRRSTYQESEKARENYQKGEKSTNGLVGADLLEKALVGETKSQEKGGTFHWLFPQLKRLNVPPQQIQRLLEQLDIRLVFTAHPTEIVRHTIRLKQRRIATLLRRLDQAEEAFRGMGLSSSWEAESIIEQLNEEIRLWWRTDELHQFKPSVLDEVDYTLHYFDEVLCSALPQLSQRLQQALQANFPRIKPPHNTCLLYTSPSPRDQ